MNWECMGRRGNCYDNALAESFFQILKRERIRRKIYSGRKEARRDIFITSNPSTTRNAAMVTLLAWLR